jgi:hypothetical protein
VKNISEPAELDRTLSVIRFRNAQQKNIATLTNFACHPTIMDDATTAASSDYVWGYYRYLDSLQGGVNAFFQGSIGGWIQPEDVPSSFDNANFYGTRLAAYASSLLQKSKRSIKSDIWFRSSSVEFPVVNPMFKMLSKNEIIKRAFGETVQSEIAFFQIGDAQFATHPGETVPQMSWDTKQLMKTEGPKFVIGLGQDALGYILKPTFFDASKNIPHSDYLTGMSKPCRSSWKHFRNYPINEANYFLSHFDVTKKSAKPERTVMSPKMENTLKSIFPNSSRLS